MSGVTTREKRTALHLSILGLLTMAAAVSAVSVRDPEGVPLRIGMILLMVGVALWVPWQGIIPAAIAIWLGPNYAYSLSEGRQLFDLNMLLELPGILGVAGFTGLARLAVSRLEAESILLVVSSDESDDSDLAAHAARLRRAGMAPRLLVNDVEALDGVQTPTPTAAVDNLEPSAGGHSAPHSGKEESLEDLLRLLDETLNRRRSERLGPAA